MTTAALKHQYNAAKFSSSHPIPSLTSAPHILPSPASAIVSLQSARAPWKYVKVYLRYCIDMSESCIYSKNSHWCNRCYNVRADYKPSWSNLMLTPGHHRNDCIQRNCWSRLDLNLSHISKTVTASCAISSPHHHVGRCYSHLSCLCLTRLDYGCTTLAGLPTWHLDRRQLVLYAAERLRYLLWLRVRFGLSFVLPFLSTDRCLSGIAAPHYFARDQQRVADNGYRCRMRSASSSWQYTELFIVFIFSLITKCIYTFMRATQLINSIKHLTYENRPKN